MSATDLLFEPLNRSGKSIAPPTSGAPTGSSGNGIIIAPNNYTRVDIQRGHPVQLYINAASAVIDHAVQLHPSMSDVRKSAHPLPTGCMSLEDLVVRFHSGLTDFWIAQPQIMQPTQFHFDGRFGHFKFQRMPQQYIPGQTFIWFWIDTSAGQLAAIDLGIMCTHAKLSHYHAFHNQNDALSYYRP